MIDEILKTTDEENNYYEEIRVDYPVITPQKKVCNFYFFKHKWIVSSESFLYMPLKNCYPKTIFF